VASCDGPFVVLFGEEGADEEDDDRSSGGEDADEFPGFGVMMFPGFGGVGIIESGVLWPREEGSVCHTVIRLISAARSSIC